MKDEKDSIEAEINQNIFFDDEVSISIESIDKDIKKSKSQIKKINKVLKKNHFGLLKDIHEYKTDVIIEKHIKDETEVIDITEDKIEITVEDENSHSDEIIEIIEKKIESVIEDYGLDNIENNKSSNTIYDKIDISVRQKKSGAKEANKKAWKLKFIDEIKCFRKNKENASNNISNIKRKYRITTALLALFFGAFGAHKFYLGCYKLGIIYLLFSWTGITLVISIVEAVIILLMEDSRFDKRYNISFV